MTIGIGILIAAVGAVLRFAVTAEVSWIDIQTAGTILIVAGLVIAFVAAIATMSRRRTVATAPAGTRTHAVTDAPVDSAQI